MFVSMCDLMVATEQSLWPIEIFWGFLTGVFLSQQFNMLISMYGCPWVAVVLYGAY